MFETGLGTYSCYIIPYKGIAIKSQYLKPTFKNRKSNVSIWGAIVLGLKGLVHFLEKEGYMNLDIYINQILKGLGLSFYNQCIKKKDSII